MKKNKRILLSLLSLFTLMASSLCVAAPSYPCVVRLAKTNCWVGTQVTVQPIDTATQQNIGSPIVLGKDVDQISQPFVCKPKQSIAFKATISPPVWAEADTVYPSTSFFQAPSHLPSRADKWIVTLCFSKDFSSVPFPMTAEPTCECKFDKLENSQKSTSESLGRLRL